MTLVLNYSYAGSTRFFFVHRAMCTTHGVEQYVVASLNLIHLSQTRQKTRLGSTFPVRGSSRKIRARSSSVRCLDHDDPL